MNIATIQNIQAHRPWAMPNRPWVMVQVWQDLLFAHWNVNPAKLTPFIPQPLILDTYNGEAWISLSPFLVTGARPRFIPSVPLVSRFLEMNVRTYVRYQDKPGILFFSLDASNPLVVALARFAYHLPYIRAKMRCTRQADTFHYQSTRENGSFQAAYRPTSDSFLSTEGSLDHWLVERYCLYTLDAKGHLYRGEIHHPPWRLQKTHCEITSNTLGPISLGNYPSLCHYSERQDTLIWALARANV